VSQSHSATVTVSAFTANGWLETRDLSILAVNGDNLVMFVEWFEDVVGVVVSNIYETHRCLFQSAVMESDFAD
jgi:hypothetical protein